MEKECRLGSEDWQGNYNKISEGHKNCKCHGSTKIQETNIMFSNWNIKLFFLAFFLCFFYIYYFSITKLRYYMILKLSKMIWSWSYPGITLSTCNIPFDKISCKISFPLFRNLYSHKTSNFFVVMLTDMIKCKYRLPKTNRSYMRIFSIDVDLFF